MAQLVRRDLEFTACSNCRRPIALDENGGLGICWQCFQDMEAEEELQCAPDLFDDPDYDPLEDRYELDYSDCYMRDASPLC